MSGYVAQTVKRIIIPVAVLLLAMIGIGLLITKVLEHTWPFTVEDAINRGFAAHRTDPGNLITMIGSFVGSTPCIVGVTAIVAFVLLKTLHSWREPLFLCAAVSAQAVVFFFTTLAIDRQRPMVGHLDNWPRSPSTADSPWSSRCRCAAPGPRRCAGCSSWSRSTSPCPGSTGACTTRAT
jgi:undecaprenyl-diphosphatase